MAMRRKALHMARLYSKKTPSDTDPNDAGAPASISPRSRQLTRGVNARKARKPEEDAGRLATPFGFGRAFSYRENGPKSKETPCFRKFFASEPSTCRQEV